MPTLRPCHSTAYYSDELPTVIRVIIWGYPVPSHHINNCYWKLPLQPEIFNIRLKIDTRSNFSHRHGITYIIIHHFCVNTATSFFVVEWGIFGYCYPDCTLLVDPSIRVGANCLIALLADPSIVWFFRAPRWYIGPPAMPRAAVWPIVPSEARALLAVTAARGIGGGMIYQRGAQTKLGYYHYYHLISQCIIVL